MNNSTKKRKGIILAGGTGSRLFPLTQIISKQLLPVFDKPMIYYPLSTLMLAGITEIAIISTPQDLPKFKKLLGTGKQWGIKLKYIKQTKPNGIAEAFVLAKVFLKDDPSCLILGDNIYYGNDLTKILKEADQDSENATIFTYQVKDPERFGILSIDKKGLPIKIQEKPKNPKSNLAITGLYFYPKNVSSIAKKLKPSTRGELEISDLNNDYLNKKLLRTKTLNRGFTWLDTGTFDSLLEASNFISLIQNRQNTIVACPEEIAFTNKWIKKTDLLKITKSMKNTYGDYLRELI